MKTTKTKPKAEKISIYGLVDPFTGKIRYIGKAVNPKARLRQHCKPRLDQKMTPAKAWIKSVIEKGEEPRMLILELCEQNVWEEREKYYIDHFRKSGHDLTNLADGGNQPYCDAETRRKNAEKLNKGRNKGIWSVLRVLGEAAKRHEENNRPNDAFRFRYLSKMIRESTGIQRQRFEEYGMRKFHGQS